MTAGMILSLSPLAGMRVLEMHFQAPPILTPLPVCTILIYRIYGYTLVRKLGSKLFILLSGLLFISLLLVLLFQWSNEKARARQPRTGPSSYSGAGASTSSSRPGSSTAAYGYRMKDDKAQS